MQDEKLTLAEMMTNYSTQIRKIINRNRKYIVNLTVQESIRLGANVYEIRIDDIEDETESNNKAMNVIVPETEILRIIQ